MRKYLTTSLALAAVLLLATTGLALEKTAVPMPDAVGGNDWNAGVTTISVQYYNNCQGWIWIWSGWSPGDRVGICFDGCLNGTLNTTWSYCRTASPTGYGFTGTISIETPDADCCPTPGGQLAQQPWLPQSFWNTFNWGTPVPGPFIVLHTFQAMPGFTAFSAIATDFAAAGPTGLQACGLCYPLDRQVHSWYFGTAGSPLCPGSTFNDSFCDVELLVVAQLSCPISVEESTWGSIKALYQ